ncbi:MAG: hypothetical protein R3E13_00180 [Alphaproteobacteria bacterium]
MKRKILSFILFSTAMLGLFILIHALRQGEGEALASSASVAGKTIEDGAQYSAMRKRSIRRAMISDVNELMNLTGGEVRAVLNQPELIRRDLPTVIWQYRNKSCVLDVYYTTAGAKKVNKTPVAHYEIRARQKGVADEDVRESCLPSLIRARAGNNFVNLDGFYKAH